MNPHEGYLNGETPAYNICVFCGENIRTDRADLSREHNVVCSRQLTETERDVLWYAANGFDVAETAAVMHLTFDTVCGRRKKAMRRMNARTFTHAVAIAIRNRSISMPWPARGRKQPADELEPEPLADIRTHAHQLANQLRRKEP